MTLPDCMMPDGAEPCVAFQEAEERIRELEAVEAELRAYKQRYEQHVDNGCRCQFDSDGDLIWRCEKHRSLEGE